MKRSLLQFFNRVRASFFCVTFTAAKASSKSESALEGLAKNYYSRRRVARTALLCSELQELKSLKRFSSIESTREALLSAVGESSEADATIV